MDEALKRALGAAVKDKDCLSSLASALDTLHERALPKQCVGFAGLYHKLGEHKPKRRTDLSENRQGSPGESHKQAKKRPLIDVVRIMYSDTC